MHADLPYEIHDAAGPDGPHLSPRQGEVLALLALGLTQREAGERLGLSTETVRTHVRDARRALGARTVAHAVALALEHEIVILDRGAARTPSRWGRAR